MSCWSIGEIKLFLFDEFVNCEKVEGRKEMKKIIYVLCSAVHIVGVKFQVLPERNYTVK